MYGREFDLLIILEKEKVILNVETKSSRNENYKNTLKAAAKKHKLRRKVLMGCHQDILDENWKIVSLVGMPFLQPAEVDTFVQCKYCRNFVIDSDALQNLTEWTQKYIKAEKHIDREKSHDSYENLYNRLIGFMSISEHFGLESDFFIDDKRAGEKFEEAILGKNNEKGITNEMVKIASLVSFNEISENVENLENENKPIESAHNVIDVNKLKG